MNPPGCDSSEGPSWNRFSALPPPTPAAPSTWSTGRAAGVDSTAAARSADFRCVFLDDPVVRWHGAVAARARGRAARHPVQYEMMALMKTRPDRRRRLPGPRDRPRRRSPNAPALPPARSMRARGRSRQRRACSSRPATAPRSSSAAGLQVWIGYQLPRPQPRRHRGRARGPRARRRRRGALRDRRPHLPGVPPGRRAGLRPRLDRRSPPSPVRRATSSRSGSHRPRLRSNAARRGCARRCSRAPTSASSTTAGAWSRAPVRRANRTTSGVTARFIPCVPMVTDIASARLLRVVHDARAAGGLSRPHPRRRGSARGGHRGSRGTESRARWRSRAWPGSTSRAGPDSAARRSSRSCWPRRRSAWPSDPASRSPLAWVCLCPNTSIRAVEPSANGGIRAQSPPLLYSFPSPRRAEPSRDGGLCVPEWLGKPLGYGHGHSLI